MARPGLDGPPPAPRHGEPAPATDGARPGGGSWSRRRLLGAMGTALLTVPAPSGAAAKPAVPGAPVDITIRSFPINTFAPSEPTKTAFGRLEYLGGLELQSDYR
ncbi:MAG: hypothetical protein ACRCVA_30300, partial [Phreatobacter sp.]